MKNKKRVYVYCRCCGVHARRDDRLPHIKLCGACAQEYIDNAHTTINCLLESARPGEWREEMGYEQNQEGC